MEEHLNQMSGFGGQKSFVPIEFGQGPCLAHKSLCRYSKIIHVIPTTFAISHELPVDLEPETTDHKVHRTDPFPRWTFP